MVVGARFPSVEMTESRLHAMAAARSLLDVLPYKLEAGLDAFKNPFDHNKNAVGDAKDSLNSRLAHPPTSTAHLQPFTAPWLAEVARIGPARPEHLPFAHPSHPTTSLPDYYPHFSNLPPRSSYYNHPMFSAPHPYLRDYPPPPPRPPIRPYPVLDHRVPEPPGPRSPPNPSQLLPHVRPLGPPPPPPPVPDASQRDPRDSRPEALEGHSSRSTHGEPSPKRRNTQSSFQFSSPHSSSQRTHQRSHNKLLGPSIHESQQSSRSPDPRVSSQQQPSLKSQTSHCSPPPREGMPSEEQQQPSGSYYPHFRKGALVAVGSQVRRVEEMRTEDFVEAANAAEDLTLDPPSVSSIVMASSGDTATINFNFVSRNTEMSVEPSVDHPFFVLYYGWSSCNPQKTFDKYGLTVRQLQVGDLCVSLTKTTVKPKPKKQRAPPQQQVMQESTSQAVAMPPPVTTSSQYSSVSVSSTQLQQTSSIPSSLNFSTPVSTFPHDTSMQRHADLSSNLPGSSSTFEEPSTSRTSPKPDVDPSVYSESPMLKEAKKSSSPKISAKLEPNPLSSSDDVSLPINLSRHPSSPKELTRPTKNSPVNLETSSPINQQSPNPSTPFIDPGSPPQNSPHSKKSSPGLPSPCEGISFSSSLPKPDPSLADSVSKSLNEGDPSKSSSPHSKSAEQSRLSPSVTGHSGNSRVSPGGTIWRPGVSKSESKSSKKKQNEK